MIRRLAHPLELASLPTPVDAPMLACGWTEDRRVDLTTDARKRSAAQAALDLVQPGMLLGLGTGSTARFFIEALGQRVASGLNVTGIPTSAATAALAASLRIPLTETPSATLDLAVDGADEIAPDLRLIKGRGGACTREKLVALAARQLVIIADDAKLVPRLGQGVLPVEVLPFLWQQTARRLEALGGAGRLRGAEGAPYVTDNGNLIVDMQFPAPLDDPDELARTLKHLPGVVEHGLFTNLPTVCFVGEATGVRLLGSLSR